ncbi:MAG TPA: radical SAM protein, partial [Candidatus Saccharimonadales bacterium]|nr:radical SAM protein [Candidatus Saccharimonadales bacterium]
PELEESLALRYLAGALIQAGHECSVVPFNSRAGLSRARREVLRRRPGGFSGHVTAGGHFASLRAPEILRDTPGLDTVLHHDGEERIVTLAGLLASGGALPGELDGVSWRGPEGGICHRPPLRVPDLAGLARPLRRRPDRTLGVAKAPVVTSRGCAGSCSFCSIHAWHRQVPTGRLRYRAPASVAEEMVALHREHGVRVFVFHDDDFIHPDRRRALPRCREILDAARRGIVKPFAFVIKCRPDDVEADLFAYLKSRGLARAYIGIETHSQAGITALNRRVSPATNERALRILRELGVYSCFNLLLFHPDSTLEELQENLDFLGAHLAHPFDVARTELYARSTLEDRMVREGRAVGDYRAFDYCIADPRAERAFRLFADVLWERQFGEHPILHRVQDLGFRHSLLARLHPQMASPELAARVAALIRDTNADTVEYLGRLARMAVSAATAPAALEEMRREVRARDRQQTLRWTALSLELEGRAALGRAGLGRFPAAVRLPRPLIRAALALPGVGLALGCGWGNVCDPTPPPQVRFASEVEPLLVQSCGTKNCHSPAARAGGLALATGASYDSLVNRRSTEDPGRYLVEPGYPDSSYVLLKMGDPLQVPGDVMPPGSTRESRWPLLNKLYNWIGQGAKRN